MKSTRKTLKRTSNDFKSKTLKKSMSNINLSKTIFSGSKVIPAFKINDKQGNASVRINLRKNQSIYLNHGALAYKDSHVDIVTEAKDGFFKSLIRGLTTTQSMYMSKFTGTKTNNNIVCNSFLPGGILPILLKPGDKITIGGSALLAITSNLNINTKSNFITSIFVKENSFLSEIENKSINAGMLWLTSYGGYHKVVLKNDEKIKLTSGLFLATNDTSRYTISRLAKSFFSTTNFLGVNSEYMMEFTGPCIVYLESRNYQSLVVDIMNKIRPNFDNRYEFKKINTRGK